MRPRARQMAHRHRERCEACRGYFWTLKARVRWCPSCKRCLETGERELKSLLEVALYGPESRIKRELIKEFQRRLTCQNPLEVNPRKPDALAHVDCEWRGNKDWFSNQDPRALLTRLHTFCIAYFKHQMHHAFPGRFPASRLSPRWLLKSREDTKRILNAPATPMMDELEISKILTEALRSEKPRPVLGFSPFPLPF